MRGTKVTLLVLGLALLPASIAAIVLQQRSDARATTDRNLITQNSTELSGISSITEGARQTALLISQNAAFALPGLMTELRAQCEASKGSNCRQYTTERGWHSVDRALVDLWQIYGENVGAARFFLLNGKEISQVIRARVLPRNSLVGDADRPSPQARALFDQRYPYFTPALKLGPGRVFEGAPFTAPKSGQWVIPFATAVAVDMKVVGVFEFELTLEGFRAKAEQNANGRMVAILDRQHHVVVFSSADPLAFGVPIRDQSTQQELPFAAGVLQQKQKSGVATVNGHRASWQRLEKGPDNANSWTLVVAQGDTQSSLGIWAIVIAIVAAILVGAALALGRRRAKTRDGAMHDALTGLANRRKLLVDLERALGSATRGDELVLALFDLDGFEQVNDTFGLSAGDALLARLGRRLVDAVREGDAYRMGGDEFCVLSACPPSGPSAIVDRACEALSERGAGYSVTTSVGVAILPRDATEVIEALNAADKQLYANKHERKQAAGLAEAR